MAAPTAARSTSSDAQPAAASGTSMNSVEIKAVSYSSNDPVGESKVDKSPIILVFEERKVVYGRKWLAEMAFKDVIPLLEFTCRQIDPLFSADRYTLHLVLPVRPTNGAGSSPPPGSSSSTSSPSASSSLTAKGSQVAEQPGYYTALLGHASNWGEMASQAKEIYFAKVSSGLGDVRGVRSKRGFQDAGSIQDLDLMAFLPRVSMTVSVGDAMNLCMGLLLFMILLSAPYAKVVVI